MTVDSELAEFLKLLRSELTLLYGNKGFGFRIDEDVFILSFRTNSPEIPNIFEDYQDLFAKQGIEEFRLYSYQNVANLDNLAALQINHFEYHTRNTNFNQLTSLGAFQNIESLLLRGYYSSKKASLPAEVFDLRQLTQLGIYEINLTSLPAAIGRLNALEKLYFYLPGFTKIPGSIQQLRNLISFELISSAVESFPPEFFELQQLEQLSLINTLNKNLFSNIHNLLNLEELAVQKADLKDNFLKSGLPRNLHTVNLSQNKLTKIPDAVYHLENLKILDISDNHLQYVDLERFISPHLQRLDFSYNDDFPKETIEKFPSPLKFELLI